MKALEKIKLAKERVGLIAELQAGSLKGMAKIKASKRVVEIVVLLGGTVDEPEVAPPVEDAPVTNAVYQGVLDGADITRDLIVQVRAEAEKDLTHPQLRPAVMIIKDKVPALSNAA